MTKYTWGENCESACYCKATDCPAGFEKVLDFKRAGLTIYRHLKQPKKQDTEIAEQNLRAQENVFIFHNTMDVDLYPGDILPEIEKNAIKCPRCRQIMDHALRILQKVISISKNIALGVCDHCKLKEQPCCKCLGAIKQFTRTKENLRTKIEVNKWLAKVQGELAGIKDDDNEHHPGRSKYFTSDDDMQSRARTDDRLEQRIEKYDAHDTLLDKKEEVQLGRNKDETKKDIADKEKALKIYERKGLSETEIRKWQSEADIFDKGQMKGKIFGTPSSTSAVTLRKFKPQTSKSESEIKLSTQPKGARYDTPIPKIKGTKDELQGKLTQLKSEEKQIKSDVRQAETALITTKTETKGPKSETKYPKTDSIHPGAGSKILTGETKQLKTESKHPEAEQLKPASKQPRDEQLKPGSKHPGAEQLKPSLMHPGAEQLKPGLKHPGAELKKVTGESKQLKTESKHPGAEQPKPGSKHPGAELKKVTGESKQLKSESKHPRAEQPKPGSKHPGAELKKVTGESKQLKSESKHPGAEQPKPGSEHPGAELKKVTGETKQLKIESKHPGAEQPKPSSKHPGAELKKVTGESKQLKSESKHPRAEQPKPGSKHPGAELKKVTGESKHPGAEQPKPGSKHPGAELKKVTGESKQLKSESKHPGAEQPKPGSKHPGGELKKVTGETKQLKTESKHPGAEKLKPDSKHPGAEPKKVTPETKHLKTESKLSGAESIGRKGESRLSKADSKHEGAESKETKGETKKQISGSTEPKVTSKQQKAETTVDAIHIKSGLLADLKDTKPQKKTKSEPKGLESEAKQITSKRTETIAPSRKELIAESKAHPVRITEPTLESIAAKLNKSTKSSQHDIFVQIKVEPKESKPKKETKDSKLTSDTEKNMRIVSAEKDGSKVKKETKEKYTEIRVTDKDKKGQEKNIVKDMLSIQKNVVEDINYKSPIPISLSADKPKKPEELIKYGKDIKIRDPFENRVPQRQLVKPLPPPPQISTRTMQKKDIIVDEIKMLSPSLQFFKDYETKPLSQLMTEPEIKLHLHQHKKINENTCLMCVHSFLELDIETERKVWEIKEMIKGCQISHAVPSHDKEKEEEKEKPLLFKIGFDDYFKPSIIEPGIVKGVHSCTPKAVKTLPVKIIEQAKTLPEEEGKGVIRYSLSDRSFIDKGWTMLPTEKVVRKINVYRMRPAHPEFDWFKRNKNKRFMTYDTGERLAEFDDDGRGRWYYKNQRQALHYYDTEELNAQQRFVIFSNGEPDERGRARPYTVLATFDYLGNGVVFDHGGKIRMKYNQTEGVVLDRSIGPASHWKWHSLNDPPVLQPVMIDTHMTHKDPNIMKMGPQDQKARPDNEDMLAIEFDNFIKEKSKKLAQTFQPFQIKMKAMKINENFSLKVLDQANVYLIYRDGTTNIKLNLGMLLDHKEIVDTDTAELGEVSSNLERFPARTDSLAAMQKSVAYANYFERNRTERERRLRPPEPSASADKLTAAASRPLRLPLRAASSSTTATPCSKLRSRKPSTCNCYYDSRLF